MANSELIEVYSAAHLYEAHFIKSALEDAGIEARVVESPLLTALGELPASAVAPRVWVRAEAFDQAKKIVLDYEARRRVPKAPASEWKCNSCGELNDSSFEICWNCQRVFENKE